MEEEKSDLARAFSEDGKLKTHVGGQALLEGVMMRGKYNWAVAVREPSGSIHVEEHELATSKPKNSWLGLPFIRGCYAMFQSLTLGFKALDVASTYAFDEEGETYASLCEKKAQAQNEAARKGESAGEIEQDATETQQPAESLESQTAEVSTEVNVKDKASDEPEKQAEEKESFLGKGGMAASMVFGLVLGVALFIVAPAFVTNLLVGDYDTNPLAWNIVDGILRIAVFVLYLWLIGRMSDIKRMFAYHGAEHKTIHCFEHGLELTPENARKFPRLHVRCGTAFLIMVMLIAIFVYTILPVKPAIEAAGITDPALKLVLVIVIRILFMPLIAGISYEITVKWAGSNPDNPLVKVILWPGMQMQYLTTNEPDDSMLECAIVSMKAVLDREQREAEKQAEAEKAALANAVS